MDFWIQKRDLARYVSTFCQRQGVSFWVKLLPEVKGSLHFTRWAPHRRPGCFTPAPRYAVPCIGEAVMMNFSIVAVVVK